MQKMEQLQQSLLTALLEKGAITRREFAAVENHRMATVLGAVNELKARGLVIEPERN